MSLHNKLDNHQKQLKAFLEEHTAMVDARLANIEARLPWSESQQTQNAAEMELALGAVLQERDAALAEIERLAHEVSDDREFDGLNQELDAYKKALEEAIDEVSQKNAALYDALIEKDAINKQLRDVSMQLGSARQKIADLELQMENTRYHGCYNLTGRRALIRSVAEIFMILGGQKHLSETTGLKTSTLQPWKEINIIPFQYKEMIEKLLAERGYFADDLLFKRTKGHK